MFYKYKDRFIIVLLFLVSGLPLLGTLNHSLIYQLRFYIQNIGYFCFMVLLWKNKYTRIISIFFLLIWLVNTGISIILFTIYDCQFNLELAITILASNLDESLDFFYSYWPVISLIFLFFGILIYFIGQLAKALPAKSVKILSVLFLAIIGYKTAELAVKDHFSEKKFDFWEKILPYMALNNFGTISRAYKEQNLLESIITHLPKYSIKVNNTGIETYVIVIGESARRANFSLYGYPRLTTPREQNERPNLFNFTQAVAPAPVTIMAVPTVLSIKSIHDNDVMLLGDNIINLAKYAGFRTYWFSRQGKISKYDTAITAIAHMADRKEWIDDGYDDVLLNKLTEALNDGKQGKKLIVLHLNGSHKISCNRFPQSDAVFKDGRSSIEDCYDNSIHFTDKILGQIFDILHTKKASMLYFSDHGQIIKMKRGKMDYTHAVVRPQKQGLDVPQFIWFSPALPAYARKTGEYTDIYPTEDNYYLIYDWLGISKLGEVNTHSVLSKNFIPRAKIQIIDTDLNVFEYKNLPTENIPMNAE